MIIQFLGTKCGARWNRHSEVETTCIRMWGFWITPSVAIVVRPFLDMVRFRAMRRVTHGIFDLPVAAVGSGDHPSQNM